VSIHDYDQIDGSGPAAEDDEEEKEGEEGVKSITPVKLLHFFMEVKIEDKLDILFSFLKSHQKSKIIIFFSSRKQVRFAYQAFKALKVGQSIYELHGKQD